MRGQRKEVREKGLGEKERDIPTRNFLRQGRRRAFHLYQALRTGDTRDGDIVILTEFVLLGVKGLFI
jgi:hypothetical protein